MARFSWVERHALVVCLLALAASGPGAEGRPAQRRHHLDAPIWRVGQPETLKGQHARQLLQRGSQIAAASADAQPAQQYSLTIGQDLFGEFTCLAPCFGGYECLYQSTYLAPCDSPESSWLWDNATQHLRQRQADICLTMCPTQNSTEGPCAVHNQIISKLEQHVGTYWAECVDSPFQRWRQAPRQTWRNADNDFCITAETQSCGDLSSCTNASAPVGNQHSIIAGPCAVTPSTAWVTNATLVAAPAKLGADPPPPKTLPPTPLSEAQQLGTYQLVAAGVPGSQCLVAEYDTPCNAGVDSAVCAWHNAAVRACDVYAAAPLSQHPEDVWYSSPGANSSLQWAGAPQADGCLDECIPDEITGACAFPGVRRNVGWQQCSGAGHQVWAFSADKQQQSPTTTLTTAATGSRECLGYDPICVMDGQPLKPLPTITSDNIVIPASCWNAATNDSLSWASRPISNDTNFVPVLNNAQMQQCAAGTAGSLQLWTRNYVLSSGTASITAAAQVQVQLTMRLQGLELLTFGAAAADAVVTALARQVPDLAKSSPRVQQIAHFACQDPRRQGIGCLLTPQQLASAVGSGAARYQGKLQQVMFTAAFTATGEATGNIIDALRLTSSDGADSTIRAAQAALAAEPPVDGVTFRNLTAFDVLLSGLNQSSATVAAASGSQPSGGTIAGIVIGAVLGVGLVAALAWVFVARWRRGQRYHDALLLPTVSADLNNFDPNGGTSKQSTVMFGGKPDVSRMSVWSMKSGSSRGMRTMGKMDASIQGWYIDPAEVSICKRPEDGGDWLLGTGSYGKVYKALRGGVQDVAVKVLLATDEAQLLQFEKEIGILKSISYDRNIVQFYGATMVGSEPMLLLEYCEGGDLRGALAADNAEADIDGERQLGWYASGHRIALDVARGLSFLHGINVVHSDLKALNILLTRGWEVAKIGDVGVARFMHAKDGSGEVAMGTFAYAAPEVLLGIDSGVKSDIFSFGVVLWEIVTGGFATRGRLHPAVVPEQCPQTIADLITACMRPDPDERPTARQVFESMRDAAAPMLNWHSTADSMHNGGSSESPSTSNHASGPLHPVQEEGGSRPLIGPSPLGAPLPSNTSMVSSQGLGGTGGTNRSRGSHASNASRPSTHIERSSVSVGAAGTFSRHSGHANIPSRDTARWHRHAAVARFRAESAPIFGPWPGAQAAALQRGNSSSNVLQPSPRSKGEWAATLRPTISCGLPGAYNAYADFDAASQGQQTPPREGGLHNLPRPPAQRSALSPHLKTLSSPECAAAVTAAAAAVAGGQRHPQHAHHHRHHRAGSAEMMRSPLREASIRVASASAAEPRNPFSDARYQEQLSGELRADSDNVLAHGTGGTPHGSSLASAGSYSPPTTSQAGSGSPPGTGSPGDGSSGSRPSASQNSGRVRQPPLSPGSRQSWDGSQTPGDSTPERRRPDRIDEHRGWQGGNDNAAPLSALPPGPGSPYAAIYSLPIATLPNGEPPRLQRLDEPTYNSPPAGNPYMTFLESPSSHDFQRGERMRPSPPASPPGGMVAAAVAGSIAVATAGLAAAASAVTGLWSEPSFAPSDSGSAQAKPPGFNGAVVGPNPFGSDAQPPPNPFAAPDVQRTLPPNPFASLSASQGPEASMSPQSSSSMSVSPRRPPPSPYASMSLQSADGSSADGSGPLGSLAGGSGPLSLQTSVPGVQLQPQATVAQEGRSGSLEDRDRAVSFENWKQVEVLAASSGREAPPSAGTSSGGSPQGRSPSTSKAASPPRLQPQVVAVPAAAGAYAAFAAVSGEPWPTETSPPPTPKFAQQASGAAPAGDGGRSLSAASGEHGRRSSSSGGSAVRVWLSEPGPAMADLPQEVLAATTNSASAPPALPREVAASIAGDDSIAQQLGRRGSLRAKSAPKKPLLNPEPPAAWPGFQPQPSIGLASVRRSSAPATARMGQPDGAGGAAAAHPIFVPESSFWQPAASLELQDIWQQRWGMGQPPPPPAGEHSVRTASFATRSACEPRPQHREAEAAAQQASPPLPPPLETRPSFEDVEKFAYEDEGRQPSALVRPRSHELPESEAAEAVEASANSAAGPAALQGGSPAALPAGSSALQQPPQPVQQQQQQQPPDAAVQLPAVPPVQRGEGMAETAPAAAAAGRQIVHSVSRGSISRPDLGRPSLGRSSLGIASVSRRSVSRSASRTSLPPSAEADSAAPDTLYAAFTGPSPPQPEVTAAYAPAAAYQVAGGGAADPATPTKQRGGTSPSLLASAAAYKASRAATPDRLPVEGAAQVRAAADAAAEAMAGRFAARGATHAAHAAGKPVVPPETPTQSREPTPREASGDAPPQGRPVLRRTSVRRQTQKIRPSMLPLAALTVAGSASASSLNEDGLAALDALMEARSAAERARTAQEARLQRLEDLPARLASMRSMPPAVRTTARPTNGHAPAPSPFSNISQAASSAARAARSASVPAAVPECSGPSPRSSPGRVRLPRSPFAGDEPCTSGYFRDVTPYAPGGEPPVLRAGTGQQSYLSSRGLKHSRSLPNGNAHSPLPPGAEHPGEAAGGRSSRAQSLRRVAEAAEAAADAELDHLMADLPAWSDAERAGLLRG